METIKYYSMFRGLTLIGFMFLITEGQIYNKRKNQDVGV